MLILPREKALLRWTTIGSLVNALSVDESTSLVVLALEEWLRGGRHDPTTKECVTNKQRKRLVHILEEIVLHRVHHIGLTSAQLENLLDDRDLRGRRVQTAESGPVVRHQTRTNHVRTAVDRSRHERHLQQRRQLLLLRHCGARMYQSSLIREDAVASDESVSGDRLAEDLHSQNIRHDLLRLLQMKSAPNTRHDPNRCGAEPRGRYRQSGCPETTDARRCAARRPRREARCGCAGAPRLAVRNDPISYPSWKWGEGGRSCFLAPHRAHHVPTDRDASHKAAARNRRVNNGNVVRELRFKRSVEVLGASTTHQTVLVGELGEDTNIVASFKLNTSSSWRGRVTYE